MRRSYQKRRGGFSLLEVLVAVAVLALLYTALAGVSFQGLRMEGDAGRRFQASLLADNALTELENQFRLGSAPALGSSEEEVDQFRVETLIEGFQTELLQKAVAARRKADPREEPAKPELLASTRGVAQPYLYEINVAVFWEEAGHERSVRRTTFGFDAPRAASLLAAPSEESEDADDEDSETDNGRLFEAPEGDFE